MQLLHCYNALTAQVSLLQARKPLVEKKRRARINESLQELRTLLADTDVSLAHLPRYRLTWRGCAYWLERSLCNNTGHTIEAN